MSKSWDEIFSIVHSRRSADAALLRQMIEIRDRYHARLVIPVRSAENEPEMPQLAPQIIHDGIENTAMRANMALPQLYVPALDPDKATGVRSREYAAIRRRWLYASWDFSLLPLLLGRAYRQLSAYGTFAAVVVPDFHYERARVELRDPLTAYPELRSPGDMRPPLDCAFVYGRSTEWLAQQYGPGVFDVVGNHPDGTGLWDVVEWIDYDDIVVGVLGPRAASGFTTINPGSTRGLELRRWKNRAACVPVAVPRRVTLDAIAGQMDAATGTVDWLDRLMALNVIAAEKNIFPDMYVLSDERDEAQIVGGKWEDGRTGKVNVITGARGIGQLVSTTGPMTQAVLSQLERTGRQSGGVIPQFGGEAPGSLRTGRAIDTLGSYSVDPRVKELQDIMSAALARSINPAICEVEKGYWPSKRYFVFSGWSGDRGHVEYIPEKHGETTENTVEYAFPGTDLSQVSVAVLQLVAGGLMSKKSARRKHPMVDDADAMDEELLIERVDEGVLAALDSQIAQGALPLIDAAQIRKNLAAGMEIADAIIDADEKARARQAAEAPPPEEGQALPPEAVPGLALPGQGAETQAPPTIAPIQPGQQNLRDVLRALRSR